MIKKDSWEKWSQRWKDKLRRLKKCMNKKYKDWTKRLNRWDTWLKSMMKIMKGWDRKLGNYWLLMKKLWLRVIKREEKGLGFILWLLIWKLKANLWLFKQSKYL